MSDETKLFYYKWPNFFLNNKDARTTVLWFVYVITDINTYSYNEVAKIVIKIIIMYNFKFVI